MTLEQTKAYFDSFICEVLTSSPHTEDELQDFSCKIRQNTLEDYFKTKAWKADKNGENRIYIIRETKRLCFSSLLSAELYSLLMFLMITIVPCQTQKKASSIRSLMPGELMMMRHFRMLFSIGNTTPMSERCIQNG